MKSIIIDDYFAASATKYTAKEQDELEAHILEFGVINPLILWEKDEGIYSILDGRRRYLICKKYQLNFDIQIYGLAEIPNVDMAKQFILKLEDK